MGNLLGAPITKKETHVGQTPDGLDYGVSSMQGWRVHMEDAHIIEDRLYASKVVVNEQANTKEYNRIDLPRHSLFAVFDGHGGSYAAIYAGMNLCRVLSRQSKFVEYAKFVMERPAKEAELPNPEDRINYVQSGLALLQSALTNAFIELDKEIACALRGHKVEDADVPYNIPLNQVERTENGSNKNNYNATAAEYTGSTKAFDTAFLKLEDEADSGTTACVVLVTPDWVVCANAGDSRAVMSRLGNKTVPLSVDHKPDDQEEDRRIRAAGGYVAGGRVEGDLAVSRGLGDFRFKNISVVMAVPFSGIQSNSDSSMADSIDSNGQRNISTMTPGDQKVSPVPDIMVRDRNASQDEFIIVACDGIWDVQTNYEAVMTVADMFQEGESNLGLICEEFCDVCLGMGSKDNMTVLVVKLAAQTIGQGGGVMARRQLRESEYGCKGS